MPGRMTQNYTEITRVRERNGSIYLSCFICLAKEISGQLHTPTHTHTSVNWPALARKEHDIECTELVKRAGEIPDNSMRLQVECLT